MVHAAFWAVWVIVGLAGAKAWLTKACPPAGCSGILVGLQLPELFLWFVAWVGLGLAVSMLLSRRRGMGVKETELTRPSNAVRNDDDGLDESALMTKYEITREGDRYAFGQYRYERLADAINYARLARGRGDA